MRWRRAHRARIGWIAGLILLTLGSSRMIRLGWDADPDRVFSRADAAYRAGRPAEADAALHRLERLRPPTPVDRLLRGEVSAASGHPGEAVAEFLAIPDGHPLAPVARLRAGQVQIGRGLARPGEAAMLASLRLLPRGLQPRKELVYLYSIQHRQAELDAVFEAIDDLGALDYEYALHWAKTRSGIWDPKADVATLEKFVAADPEDRWSRLALAEGFRRLNRLDDAGRILAPLPLSGPGVRAGRARLAMDRGDFAATESLLAGGAADDPALARLRGQLALHRRDGAAAVRDFGIALAADPADRTALSGIGTAFDLMGRPDEARPYLKAAERHNDLWRLVSRAVTIDGRKDPTLPHRLGLACAATDRYPEARAWLRLAIGRDPLDAEGQRALFRLEAGGPGHRPRAAPSAMRPKSSRPPAPDGRLDGLPGVSWAR
jgi:predicted Zn-dependent protease